jgi:hypothetical protein
MAASANWLSRRSRFIVMRGNSVVDRINQTEVIKEQETIRRDRLNGPVTS